MLMIHLGVWGRVLVMCIGASVVLLSVLIALCFLAPGCWGYNYLESKEKKKLNLPTAAKLAKLDHVILSQVGSTCEVGKKIPLASSRVSVCSTVSEVSNKSLSQISDASTEAASSDCKATFSLQFLRNPESTRKEGRLIINVQEVSNLPKKLFPRHTDVYLMLQLQRGSKQTFSFQTRAIRNTRSPQFNQEFEVIAKKDEIKNSLIKISAFEQDKYTNPYELATLKVNLRSVKDLTTSMKPVKKNILMDKIQKDCGNILVGLSYLPTAGRLSVNVDRVANLHLGNTLIGRTRVCPWLRVLLLAGESGKQIQRKKSVLMKQTEQSEYTFNEVVTFNVSASNLYTVTLLIILCHKSQSGGETEMKMYVPTENNNNNINNNKESLVKDKQHKTTEKSEEFILGHVALGNLVAGNKEKKHWNLMIESPRRLVSLWHTLQ